MKEVWSSLTDTKNSVHNTNGLRSVNETSGYNLVDRLIVHFIRNTLQISAVYPILWKFIQELQLTFTSNIRMELKSDLSDFNCCYHE